MGIVRRTLVVLLIAAAGQDPGEETDRLVEDLGSERIEVRDEAAGRLKAMGLKIVPRLREAAKKVEDKEVRARIEDIIRELTRPHGEREGRKVTLRPYGIEFSVPKKWLDWHRKFHNNFHLSREELDAVEKGAGEWDTEYAEVINAALPFHRCGAHAGGEGWGRDAVAFSDLQMRVYVLDPEPEEVEKWIAKEAAGKAAGYAKKKVPVVLEEKDGWRKSLLSFGLWYGDYGATAHVDFRLRRFEDVTVAVALMYTDYQSQEKTIDAILQSVRRAGK